MQSSTSGTATTNLDPDAISKSAEILFTHFRRPADDQKRITPDAALVRAVSEHDTSAMNNDLKMWNKRYLIQLGEIAEAKNITKLSIEIFKYLLGPSFTSIRGRDWNGAYPILQWRLFDVALHFLMYDKLLEVMNTCTPLLQNEMIISQRLQDDMPRIEKEIVDCKSDQAMKEAFDKAKIIANSVKQLHDQAKQNMKSKGWSEYTKWTIDKASDIQLMLRGSFLNPRPENPSVTVVLIDDNSIKLSKPIQDAITDIYNTWVLPHITTQISGLFNIEECAELKDYLKNQCNKLLSDLFNFKDNVNLQALKADLTARLAVFNLDREYEDLILQAKRRLQIYLNDKQKIESDYRQFAMALFPQIEGSILKIICSDENGYPGMKSGEQLANLIIEYKSLSNVSRHPSVGVEALFRLVNSIMDDNVRSQLLSLMEQHWNSPRYQQVVDGHAVKKVNKDINTLKKLLEGSELPVDIVNAPQRSDSHFWLKSAIESPLDWQELKLLLNDLICQSEAQLMLKMQLLEYVDSKLDLWFHQRIYLSAVSTLTTADKSLSRRREVEYLIGCLYLASENRKDKGYLHDVDNDGLSVGVTYIVEVISEVAFTSQLKLKLQHFIEYVASNIILSRAVELRTIMTAPETPKQSTESKDLQESKQEKQPVVVYGKNTRSTALTQMFGVFHPRAANPALIAEFQQSIKDKMPVI